MSLLADPTMRAAMRAAELEARLPASALAYLSGLRAQMDCRAVSYEQLAFARELAAARFLACTPPLAPAALSAAQVTRIQAAVAALA